MKAPAARSSTPFSASALRADRAVLRRAHPVAYPVVRGLDRFGDAARVPGLGVVVNDPTLARRVLVDTRSYRKDGPGSPAELWSPVVGDRALTTMDGDEHRRLRSALNGLFSAGSCAALVARAAGAALDGATGRLRAGEAVDVAALVRDVAGVVVGRLLGLPGPVPDAAALTAGIGLRTRRLTSEQVRQARAVLAPVTERAATAGPLRSAGLTRQEAGGVAGVLVLTGTETVVSFLPRLVALAADSGLFAHPAGLASPALLDEALRVTVPTPATVRRAAVDTRLGPARVDAGDRVLVLTLNATRSPRHGTDTLRQLWFGAGAHFCIGRPLALAQARALLLALAAGVPPGGSLEVVSRRARTGVLIPAWDRLLVSASGVPR